MIEISGYHGSENVDCKILHSLICGYTLSTFWRNIPSPSSILKIFPPPLARLHIIITQKTSPQLDDCAHDDLGRMWQEAVMTYFYVLSQNYRGEAEVNQEKQISGWPLSSLIIATQCLLTMKQSGNQYTVTCGLLCCLHGLGYLIQQPGYRLDDQCLIPSRSGGGLSFCHPIQS
jgi:hypothetical protein